MQAEVWKAWLEKLYSLRRDKLGNHERPHKPVLLLSVIHLLDRGAITENRITISAELVTTFEAYFKVVRRNNDQPSFQNPFYFLSGDLFWHLVLKSGEQPIYEPGSVKRAPSLAELKRRVAYARFDDALWNLLSEPASRHQLREAIVARYFPEHRTALLKLVVDSKPASSDDALNDRLPPGRDAAFRRTILESTTTDVPRVESESCWSIISRWLKRRT